ncbi:glycoside hydrolase family 37 protein [Teratosphaeria nubilosa]|uniref:Trehalase n=1 Tax=Teratosphaeria nubilosa TaxID=161662 RepID=A0A6G1LQX2_9PEZI|nr:glycoside hydrolase family 37 protein [Teratosphaeria nubilosa]
MKILVASTAILPLASAIYRKDSVTAPCDSPLYCHGEILHQIQLAKPFDDSKTFVDLPTTRPLDEVIAAFEDLEKPLSNNSDLQSFLTTYFGKPGSELLEPNKDDFKTDPTFLDHVQDANIRDFVQQIINIWPDLTRSYAGGGNCTGCVSSFIPLSRTFVVAGGRFRESYYWDSYWILLGLLRTRGSFTQIASNIIENFLDLVDQFGFVPNGARVYYLNRSQPPVLAEMVRAYVEYTSDTSLVARAIPTLVKEYAFWTQNRTVDIDIDGKTYTLNHYAVENNQPRPESYLEDYHTAMNDSYYAASGKIYPGINLTQTQIDQLYQDLASGAESGWDYSSRWIANPNNAINDDYFPLRSLNTVNIIPVDLNSILYSSETTIAYLYGLTGNVLAANAWTEIAASRSANMTAVLWDKEHCSYFDYNISSCSLNRYVPADKDAIAAETTGAPPGQQLFTHIAQFYPFWTGAAPEHIKNDPAAVLDVYRRIQSQLDRYPGAPPATNLVTGQQWDKPNIWPPHVQILIQGLLNIPPSSDPNYAATQALALEIAQRYLDSTFCTWRTSGGQTSGLPKLQTVEKDEDFGGAMFEKYNSSDILKYGGGGEYKPQLGFGWSNGVLIWIADVFGVNLTLPACEAALERGSEPKGNKKRVAEWTMMGTKRAFH